jgi:hypothetical protein
MGIRSDEHGDDDILRTSPQAVLDGVSQKWASFVKRLKFSCFLTSMSESATAPVTDEAAIPLGTSSGGRTSGKGWKSLKTATMYVQS